MRQLEQILGADELRDGLREYLTRFAFANATWTDLIEILDRAHRRRPRGLEPRLGRRARAADDRDEPRDRERQSLAPLVLAVGSARPTRSCGTSSCRSRSATSMARASPTLKMNGAVGRCAARRRSARSELHPAERRRHAATGCSSSTTESRQFFLITCARSATA